MSHSIHMLSIQIDTQSLELVICHQFNNIKYSFPLCKFDRCCTVIRYSRVKRHEACKDSFLPFLPSLEANTVMKKVMSFMTFKDDYFSRHDYVLLSLEWRHAFKNEFKYIQLAFFVPICFAL